MDSERPYNNPRSEAAERLINELRMQIQVQRSSQFNRTLLSYIEKNPNLTIRQCWEDVENDFARRNKVSPRRYPYRFEN